MVNFFVRLLQISLVRLASAHPFAFLFIVLAAAFLLFVFVIA